MNWIKIGWELGRLLASTLLSVLIITLGYRKYVAPDLLSALNEAIKTTKTIASIGSIKRVEREGNAALVKAVTADLVKNQFPELEMVKLVVAPDTWEQIENALETNPTGVMELLDKYGHYFRQGEDGQTPQTFDF